MSGEKNVHQRLAEVMRNVTYIQKETKRGMQYSIVSHDKVTAKARPALLDAGIVYYPVKCVHSHNGNRAECSMTVRFVNIDNPDDFFDVPTFGYGIDPQDKGPGKAMSYAVKYAVLKALGLETGDDPDHDDLPHEKSDPAVNNPKPKLKPDPKPQRNSSDVRSQLKGWIESQTDASILSTAWEQNGNIRADLNFLPEPMQNEVNAAYKKKLADLGGTG